MKYLFSLYHWFWSVFGRIIYGNPSKQMTVICITGTNGKSTVVDLTTRILEEAGYKVVSVSSLRMKLGSKEWRNELKMTMPGRAFLQKFLSRAKNQGATHAVIEVTSEGIRQFRHKGIDFDAVVLTNVTPEHIESHGSFEKYRKAKEKIFTELSRSKKPKRIAVVNGDDPSAECFLKYDAEEKWIYGLKFKIQSSKFKIDNLKILKAENYKLSEKEIELEVEGEIIRSPLLGEFNAENILAATAVSRAFNISWEIIKKAIEKAKNIPGRLEFINEGQDFKIVVDYAHTPDSLEKVYKNLKSIFGAKSLICVIGAAGGGRDKWKRPELGKIANQYCQKVIVTNEDPYDENPSQILSEIESGISNFSRFAKRIEDPRFRKAESGQITNFEKILDRKEAIKKAIESAKTGDIVIITGKGAEPWLMGPRGTKTPWDDREIARKALQDIKTSPSHFSG